ncbi:MAG: hypothetical protein NZ951_04195 [Dehalococcoidia bacterium]|nr:hypothetical protein [Dehalococcoidia bacterium]MDW8119637.1 hypothetical protein [Chloroflexota bacterium]
MRGLLFLVIVLLGVLPSAIYAARIPSASAQPVGGQQGQVLSPVSAFTVEAIPAQFNASGQVTHYKLRWFPTAGTGTYHLQVLLLNSGGTIIGSGNLNVTVNSIGSWRTDTVPLSSPVTIDNIATVRVNIVS